MNYGDIELDNGINGSAFQQFVYKIDKTYAHKLWVEKDGRKGVFTTPIIVEDWNVNAGIHSTLIHPSNLLAKFGLPNLRLEEITF